MKEENESILSALADGRQRSFNAVQLAVALESTRLQNDLNLLIDSGFIGQTVVPDDDYYAITARGMLAVKSF